MSIKSIAIELLRSRRRAHWAAQKNVSLLPLRKEKKLKQSGGGSGLNLTLSGMSITRR